MKIHTLAQEQRLPITREEAWEFFSSPSNLSEITPPDVDFEVINEPGDSIFEGQVIVYRIGILPLVRISWVTEIKCVESGYSFIDEQRFGPYKFWLHRHTFEDIPGGVLTRDLVHYGLGFGPFGGLAHALFVRRKLADIFGFRRKMLEERFGKL
jgi:ligand-binding SRPBCC domain-containing protein